MQKVQGWVEAGNTTLSISGAPGTISRKVQGSFPSATVTVYLAGTLTLATLYSDTNRTAKANPFTAASDGTWSFYIDGGRYDIKFSGGGIAAPFTIGDVWVSDEFLNIIQFGAVGDGVTDDTSAIQTALDLGDIIIPPGFTFLVTGLFVPSNRRVHGTWGSVIKLKDNTSAPVITCEDVDGWMIDGVRIDGNKANQSSSVCCGIFVEGATSGKITGCYIENTRIESVLISKNETSGAIPDTIVVDGNISINPGFSGGFRQHYAATAGRNVNFADNIGKSTDGFASNLIDLEPNNAANPIEGCTVIGNIGKSVGGVQISSAHGQIIKGITVSGNHCVGFGAGRGACYTIHGALYVAFSGNTGDGAGTNGLQVEDSDFVSIAGNTLRNYAVDSIAGEMDGIQLTNSEGITIGDNTLQSSNAAAFGIRETAADCITFVGNNRIDTAVANQVQLLSTNSVLMFRRFDKDGNPYGNLTLSASLGSSAAIEAGWTGSNVLLRNNGAATMDFRTTTLAVGTDPLLGTVTGIIVATVAWDPASIADGAVDTLTTSPAGLSTAAIGDLVSVSFSNAIPAGMILAGQVVATGQIQVTLFNKTGVGQDLSAGTLKIMVIKAS